MEFAVQLAQLIGTGALVATLIVVIIYTVKTSAMAKATKALADAEDKNTEFRERPIIRFVVGKKEEIWKMNDRTKEHTIELKRPFNFPTLIDNVGIVHAKVRVKATVLHRKKQLRLPEGGLYVGNRNLEMQTGTGIHGHLSFENLFKNNGVVVMTKEEAGDSLTKYKGRELLVRLESKVVNYYKPDSDFDTDLSKNPPAYYRWKGDFAIDALGSWVPEYDVDDFVSFPEMS